MSAYIKLSTLEYPRHAGDIALDPVGQAGYALVAVTPRPDFDPGLERCIEGKPELVDGAWRTTWIVRAATQEEIDLEKSMQSGQPSPMRAKFFPG